MTEMPCQYCVHDDIQAEFENPFRLTDIRMLVDN